MWILQVKTASPSTKFTALVLALLIGSFTVSLFSDRATINAGTVSPTSSGSSFSAGSPGPIGGTSSSTGQFTALCTGASPCTLPAAGQISVGSAPLLLSSSASGVSGANYAVNVNTGAGVLELNAISGGQVQFDIAASTKFVVTGSGVAYANDSFVNSMARSGWAFDEGPDTSLSANESMGTWFMPKAVTIEKITLDIRTSPTCSVSEQITCFDCGNAAGACTAGQTSTIMSAITIASGATRQSIDEAINVATVAAGEYISCHITAGTCTVSNNSIQIVTRPQ